MLNKKALIKYILIISDICIKTTVTYSLIHTLLASGALASFPGSFSENKGTGYEATGAHAHISERRKHTLIIIILSAR